MWIADLSSPSQLPKSSQTSKSQPQWVPSHLYLLLSGPRPGSSSSQPRFTAWLHMGTTKPSTSSSHLRCFIAQAGWLQAKTQAGADLGDIAWTTTECAHPVDSCRPCRSTTTLPIHGWSSTEGRGWWCMVTANPCSWLAWVNPFRWSANSN